MIKLAHGKRLNTNFNRTEENGKHGYLNYFAETTIGTCEYEGYIKLKLFHL